MSRLGTAGRIALLVAGALLLANAIALAILGLERREAVGLARLGAEVDRAAALVRLVEDDPARAARAVRAARGRGFEARLGPRPAVAEPGMGRAMARVAEALRTELGEPAREVRAALRAPSGGERGRLILSVRTEAGWLNIAYRREATPRARLSWLATVLGMLAVGAVALWSVGRLTAPITALQRAAEAAGRGDRTARVPEAGPPEARRAAAAFNAMQDGLARLEAERATAVAAIGHDLRTPIASLRIRAEMMEDDQRDPVVRTLGEMEALADALLDWGRAQAEPEAAEATDLAALARAASGDGVAYEGPEALHARVRPVTLGRALGNLAVNMRRHAQGGVLRVTADADGVTIRAEDRGPGVPEDVLPSLFEPFVRGDAARAPGGGAGLGLAVVREAARAHGGTASARNRTGGGLVVEMRLPRAEGDAPAPGRG